MSSLVIFERSGVVAQWNKGLAYTVTACEDDSENTRYYSTREEAMTAAENLAQRRENPAATPQAAPSAPSTIKDVIALARAFGEEVQGAFTVDEFRTICERNKSGGAYDRGCCATQDFADANMLMLSAFVATFDREPWFLTDSNHPKGEADTRLWNDAWEVARAAEFFA